MLMDRKIFNMNLSVETTSAYILICSLAESGAPVTIESLGSFWNGEPRALSAALDELLSRRIIQEEMDHRLMRTYVPNSSDLWERSPV